MLRFLFLLLACSSISCEVINRSSEELKYVRGRKYRVILVADHNGGYLKPGQCGSYVMQANLSFSKDYTVAKFENGRHGTVTINCEMGSKRTELSDLVYFRKEIYTCDGSTGIVYKFNEDFTSLQEVERLKDGDGTSDGGFKCKWMAVKNDSLYIGSHGRPRTNDDGTIKHRNDEWVKIITKYGEVIHMNWSRVYEELRVSLLHSFPVPGYLIHEAVAFNEIEKSWYFMPRMASKVAFDPETEEVQGTNLFLVKHLSSKKVGVHHLGPLVNNRGVSSMKFFRFKNPKILVVLKTAEAGKLIFSYIGIYKIVGKSYEVLLEDTFFANDKFEAIEFQRIYAEIY